jgi:citrate lyase gamma subunit
MVAALLSGYDWRWGASKLKVIATEQSFRLPLRNPATGKPSQLFELAGVIDGIVRMEDSRLAVMEHKTASEDLALGSDYWLRLQNDLQISIYVHAARELGHDVSTVFYDVIRKPSIKPTRVPLLDRTGLKIVLNADGQRVLKKDGMPRQTGDTAKSYVLQSRPMTPDEWSQRIIDDIAKRPDFYYARVEIPRLDQEIEECRAELWTLREAQRNNRWYRTVTRDTCGFCSYFGLCSSKTDLSSGVAPEGFEFVSNVHPELKGLSDE